MYSISGYGEMIADRPRMKAYVRALRGAVRPGAVVLDIGTGTGIFALLACQFGARRVYAIEPSEAVQVAKEIAAANHFAEKIEFIPSLSTRITLPERADVIISDLRGVLPQFEQNVRSIADARQRFLAPGGTMIPLRDTLWAAVVTAPKMYRRLTSAWSENQWDLDLRAAHNVVINTVSRVEVRPAQLLSAPRLWATLDYMAVENPNFSAELTWKVAKRGTAHGLCVWFDSLLARNIRISNRPGAPKLIYGQMFFPWSEPVSIGKGDVVTVCLHADFVREDYIWRWDTCVRPHGARAATAQFQQSTFFGAPLCAAHLRKREAHYTPALDEEGQIDRLILSLMDGQTPQEEIARRTAEKYPERFVRWEDALTRVTELSRKYSR